MPQDVADARVYMTQMSSAARRAGAVRHQRGADARARRLHRAARHARDDQGDRRLDVPDVLVDAGRRTWRRSATTGRRSCARRSTTTSCARPTARCRRAGPAARCPICFNPYLETDLGATKPYTMDGRTFPADPMAGTRANCQNCHRRAAYPAFDPTDPGRGRFRPRLQRRLPLAGRSVLREAAEGRLHVVDRAQERRAVSVRGTVRAMRRSVLRSSVWNRRRCRRMKFRCRCADARPGARRSLPLPAVAQGDEMLQKVVIVSRHGVRTPIPSRCRARDWACASVADVVRSPPAT